MGRTPIPGRFHVMAIDLALNAFYVVEPAVTWKSAMVAVEDAYANEKLEDTVLLAWPASAPFPHNLRCLNDESMFNFVNMITDCQMAYDLAIENM